MGSSTFNTSILLAFSLIDQIFIIGDNDKHLRNGLLSRNAGANELLSGVLRIREKYEDCQKYLNRNASGLQSCLNITRFDLRYVKHTIVLKIPMDLKQSSTQLTQSLKKLLTKHNTGVNFWFIMSMY